MAAANHGRTGHGCSCEPKSGEGRVGQGGSTSSPYLARARVAQHQFLGRPSGQAERRQRETQRDRRPEKPLTSAPRLAPRHDDAGGDERWNEKGTRAKPA
jgi:hypothetical protein